jgi:glycosyltransferase involved in cell wall biosynthesis
MKSIPLISIITPVYNVEQYLPQCIESVINQTFQNWELLLIDDGSTDRSGIICDEYALKDERIRVLHKENSGQSDSRNMALLLAKAELIGFVDSDDWLEPDMYAMLYRTLINCQADIAICGNLNS